MLNIKMFNTKIKQNNFTSFIKSDGSKVDAFVRKIDENGVLLAYHENGKLKQKYFKNINTPQK